MHGTANTIHAVIHAGINIVELILYRQSQPELRQRGVNLRTPQNNNLFLHVLQHQRIILNFHIKQLYYLTISCESNCLHTCTANSRHTTLIISSVEGVLSVAFSFHSGLRLFLITLLLNTVSEPYFTTM